EASAMVIDQTSELRAHTTALEQQAMHDATHDHLTDLPNRVLLRDRLEQAINAAQFYAEGLVAVLVMDLDRFKEINDTLGHYNGDRLLTQVAARLQGAVKDNVTVARLGGDEFAIMLPKVATVKEAAEVARMIGKALEAPFGLEGLKLDVQASIGIAVFPQHGPDADTLFQRADVAMHMAKQEKGRGYVVYDPKLDKHSPHRLTLVAELRHAIDADQLVLHYQPKVSIQAKEIVEVEALVRWEHPQYGLMKPDDFIPLAERTGLIKPLTMWVLAEALRQHAEWQQAGLDIGVAVNLSPHGLLDMELPDLVEGLLAQYHAPPERLILEITETTIMVDQERALQILTRLADRGIRLSIDDFGTGYSSLSYLSKLPVQEIKIDKSFVMDMIDNDNHAMIVQATIDLAHNLRLEVIGEGTRSLEVLERLRGLGCDAAQGDYISIPVSAADFESWVQSSAWKPRRQQPHKPAAVTGVEPRAKSAPAPSVKAKPDKESIETFIKESEDFLGQVDLRTDLDKPGGRKRARR
ncbi:MAG: EAL domain-containing protein, partial [Acidiferrobacterales bacterium]|nr:EAL domain-containing protein [Acidiferrobacterales bacterium]